MLTEAKKETANWLMNQHRFSKRDANIAAENIVNNWINIRTEFIDEFFGCEINRNGKLIEIGGIDGLDQLYLMDKKTCDSEQPY